MSLLTVISQVMQQKGDKLTIAIESLDEGTTLRLVVTPRLGPAPANQTKQEADLRAAMRLPLIVTGTSEECETKLHTHITQYSRHLDDTADSLRRMAESRAKAEHTEANSRPKKGKTEGDSASKPEAEVSVKQATTPEHENIGGIGAF